METVLQGIPYSMVYIDDILVTGANDQDHLRNLDEVLQRLQQWGARVNLGKCAFMQESVEYLGYRIDAEGVHPTGSKLEVIIGAPVPQNIQQLRSFLGLLNCYEKCIPDLATVINPLNSLLKKNQEWAWMEDCSKAFKMAQERLTSSSVLVHFNPKWPIILACDASPYGDGAVISHVLPDGSEIDEYGTEVRSN